MAISILCRVIDMIMNSSISCNKKKKFNKQIEQLHHVLDGDQIFLSFVWGSKIVQFRLLVFRRLLHGIHGMDGLLCERETVSEKYWRCIFAPSQAWGLRGGWGQEEEEAKRQRSPCCAVSAIWGQVHLPILLPQSTGPHILLVNRSQVRVTPEQGSDWAGGSGTPAVQYQPQPAYTRTSQVRFPNPLSNQPQQA